MRTVAIRIATTTLFLVLTLSLTLASHAQNPFHGGPSDAMWGTPARVEHRAGVEYRVLPRPVKPHSHRYEPATPAPTMVSKPIQPYAYGWFGSSTHPHWSRHFGTRNAFTQWTLK